MLLSLLIENFNILLAVMAILAVVVFIILQFISPGYGMTRNKKWGYEINNKLGWILMELPIFVMMTFLWSNSDRMLWSVPLIIFIIFQIHYFHRTFIYPLTLRGSATMPLSIVVLGIFFNLINAIMQGGWIFYVAPEEMYTPSWLYTPQFIIGFFVFFIGMYINKKSDDIILNLRKPGDTNYYIPYGGLFKYVSSANYLGELIQWIGFAILTWSVAGAVFVLWTFANLGPRARAVRKQYAIQFGKEFTDLKRKAIIPFLY